MPDSPKLSRRDWFRLRLGKSKQETPKVAEPKSVARIEREPSVGQTTAGLQQIPHPENHDGLDLSELPPMREAVLSGEQVEQLFQDIGSLATDVLLMQRSRGAARATAATASSAEQLSMAKESLLAGQIARLQIRYRWQDTAWIDTLESKDVGYRLVRIAHKNS